MLNWSKEFATGSDLVDLQHQRLIENINLLETLLEGPPPPRSAYDELVSFLEQYVATHFKLEESCMESYRCPAHEQNNREHSAFLEAVRQFKQIYLADGPKPELLHTFHRLASEWITHHILTVDIQLKGCINSHWNQPTRQPESDDVS